jgi:SAM-dependent methyltransferase
MPGRFQSVLKTDLFDELASPGVYPALSSRAAEVVGIDISPETCRAASARHPGLKTEVATVTDLPFEDAGFDAALSNSTLDHLSTRREVAAALAELARVIRPGGRLVITLDNPLNPLVAARNAMPAQLARRLRGVSYGAGWTCGPRGLRELLEESGFDVSQQTAVMHAPRVLVAQLDRRRPWGRDPGRLIARLLAAERLERWPTRYLTGHFVAALGIRSKP